jgi:hypothetical protein
MNSSRKVNRLFGHAVCATVVATAALIGPVQARVATNMLAGNMLAGNMLAANTGTSHAGVGGFSGVTEIELPDGTRLTR